MPRGGGPLGGQTVNDACLVRVKINGHTSCHPKECEKCDPDPSSGNVVEWEILGTIWLVMDCVIGRR